MSVTTKLSDGGIFVITLDEPDRRNPLGHAVRVALASALSKAEGDNGVIAVVLTGAGGNFSAGGDIRDQRNRSIADHRERFATVTDMVDRKTRCCNPSSLNGTTNYKPKVVDFHRDLTRLLVMFLVWCCGQVPVFLHCGSGLVRRAVLEAVEVVSGFEDVAVMDEPIEQRSRHLGVAKHAGPFAEAEVGGDDDAGALIEFAQQMEEQCAT